EGGPARVEKILEIGHRGMEAPRTAIGGSGGDREEAGPREREVGAGGGVGEVTGGVAGRSRAGGDDEIVGVVSAVQEEADQRLVIGWKRRGRRRDLAAAGGIGSCTHEAEAAESGEETGGADCSAAGATQEFAAGNFG